jgi:hypothetical protein
MDSHTPVDRRELPMTQCRLIYQSTCSAKPIDNADLRELVQKSAGHNRAAAITGLLLLSGDQFLQVLEGPADAVNRLFGRIVRDKRHRDVRLLSFEQIGPVYFNDWSMHLVDLFDLPKAPRELLARKYRSREGAVEIPERLHEVYGLLLDARHICLSRPWEGADPGGPT